MAENPAKPSDIIARWRQLTPDDDPFVAALLGDAWALLKRHDPTIDTRLDADTLDPALVKVVVTAMVLRVLRNPDGLRQESIQDYSYTRDAAAASGVMQVLDDELALLADPDAGTAGAFTIAPAYKIKADSSTYLADDWEWSP